MRLLAQNPLRYRRQILALKQFFIGRNCTVLLLDDRTSETEDLQLHSIAHGVVGLEQLSPEYGAERRRVRVTKLRGQRYRGGFHDFVIEAGGLKSKRAATSIGIALEGASAQQATHRRAEGSKDLLQDLFEVDGFCIVPALGDDHADKCQGRLEICRVGRLTN